MGGAVHPRQNAKNQGNAKHDPGISGAKSDDALNDRSRHSLVLTIAIGYPRALPTDSSDQ
jgi:hypothetical protein